MKTTEPTTPATKTCTVTFVECNSDRDSFSETVELEQGDDVAAVIDRAAAQWCPADEPTDWRDLDDDDERKWDETDLNADCMGAGFFFRDNGISTEDRWYGQIFRPVSERQGNGNSSVTGRVYVDIEYIEFAIEEMETNETTE